MGNRAFEKTWGTWYTADGERADAWPTETRRASSGAGVNMESVVSSSVHGLASAGGGLSSVLQQGLLGGGEGGPFGGAGSLL